MKQVECRQAPDAVPFAPPGRDDTLRNAAHRRRKSGGEDEAPPISLPSRPGNRFAL
jgi:hypothetical protein